MNNPALKPFLAINGASATAAGTVACTAIDTMGADWATIDLWGTTQLASTQAGSPSVLKLQESDSTSATTFVDVVGFRGGSATSTSLDFLVGIGLTSGVNSYKFNVDCRARKRFLSVQVSPATSQTFSCIVNLGRLEAEPITATKAGVLSLVEA